MEKVSIIVPVFNAEKTLHMCLKSIVNQTYNNIEVILIDDGSIDDSFKICEDASKKDSRVMVFRKNNGGANSARAYGVAMAKGDFINFVDSDDTIPYNSIELLMSHSNEDIDIIQGGRLFSTKGGIQRFSGFKKPGIVNHMIFIKYLFGDGYASGGPYASLYRRTLFSSETFDLPKEVKLGEDFYMNLCLGIKARNVGLFNDIVYIYQENDNSVTHNYEFSSIRPFSERHECIKRELVKAELFDKFKIEFYNMAITDLVVACLHNTDLVGDPYVLHLATEAESYMSSIKNKCLCEILKYPRIMKVLYWLNLIRKLI